MCQRCGLQSKPGEKKTMVVVEKREREYYGERFKTRADGSVSSGGVAYQGRGFENVREEAACETCVKIPVVVQTARLPGFEGNAA